MGGAGDTMMRGRFGGGLPGAGGAVGRGAGSMNLPGLPATGRQQPGQATTLYWLYQRPAGALLVLTLNAKGSVNSITLNGSLPFSSGRTSKGVSLGTDYMAVIARYGYPDQAVTNGATLQLTYVDYGVRFLLEGMRVNQITIGSYVEAAKANLPAVQAAPPRGPTGPGLGLDELKGYM